MSGEKERKLNINDLAQLDDLLSRHGFSETNRYKLGIQLGLSANTLDAIEANSKRDDTRCLMEFLKAWLKEADDVQSKGGATIVALIKALRKIGEKDTADKICNEIHPACRILKQYISSEQSIIAEATPRLSLFLLKEGVIGAMLVPKAKTAAVLLSTVQESVCDDYRNLDKLGAVLLQLPSTAAIGTLIRKDYVEKVSSESGVVRKKSLKVPSVDEFVEMRRAYAFAITNACKSMSAIPQPDLKKFLCRGYPYLAPQLDCLDTTDDILDVICRERCSITSVSLLEDIACYFKKEEAIASIDEYKKNLHEFKPLQKVVAYQELFSGSPLTCETITFIVDKSVDDCTLDDVQLLLSKAFKELAPHVIIKVIKESNSFIVVCSFPLSLSDQLIATAEENIEVLKEQGVKKLTIGHCIVYDNENAVKIEEGVQDKEFIPLPSTDKKECNIQTKKLEQLILSENVKLLREQEEQKKIADEEIQRLQAKLEQVFADEAHKKHEQEKKFEALSKKNEELLQEISMLTENGQFPEDSNPMMFQDDIYGEIVIDDPLIIEFVKTQQFQRLKDIKKLGYTYQNIPKATYSRLQHSIGMYYLAGKYVKKLRKKQPELKITRCDVMCVEIAALCYNLGFGPFSHTFGLFLNEIFEENSEEKRPWKKTSEASVQMLDHMIDNNAQLKQLLTKSLKNYEEDIVFIKELINGARKGVRKGKEFLYEIVINKTSELDVYMIDYTTRDAAVLGTNINFKWRVFLNKVKVKECEDGEKHIFFLKDDLDTYNDLFRTRHSLYRDLYYLRKNRIVALMIKRILVRSNKTPIIKAGNDPNRQTISDATKNLVAYTQLNDSILNGIKLFVDDPHVCDLLYCLDTLKLIGQIGYVVPTPKWNQEEIKKHIIRETTSCKITDILIIDPIQNGYEHYHSTTQRFYTSDGKKGKWKTEWAHPPPYAEPAPLRIFLVSGDKRLIKEVQQALSGLIADDFEEQLEGAIYPDKDNNDLIPGKESTEASSHNISEPLLNDDLISSDEQHELQNDEVLKGKLDPNQDNADLMPPTIAASVLQKV